MQLPDNAIALLLDFDGTLVDIAPHPDLVRHPAALQPTLAALHSALDGAVACISGRAYRDLARQLDMAQLPLVGSHGAEFLQPAPTNPQLQALAQQCVQALAAWPQALVESKPCGLALHWRQAPKAEATIRRLGQLLLTTLPGHRLCEGKQVLELLPQAANKGAALRRLMQRPPFRGRSPVFIGDDYTDIAAMQAAQALGGQAVAVGPRVQQHADHHLATPAHVLAWLQQMAATADRLRQPLHIHSQNGI